MGNPLTVPDLFKQTKAVWLNNARDIAEDLARKRPAITIEDVLEVYKLPKYLHRNTIGQVFNDRRFVSVGFVKSQRPVSNGRVIQKWTLRDDYLVESEQDCE